MIRLVIADDHSIVREGLQHLLSHYEEFRLVAEAENGQALLSLLDTEQPDIVLLDMMMPGLSGLALIETLHTRFPDLPVLILSMHNEPQIARRAIRAGARGYLSKDCDALTLTSAIRRLARGGRYIQSDIAESLAFHDVEQEEQPRHETLSRREFHVLCLLARGISINAIAEQLGISNKTVSTHKFRMMQKMDFNSQADVVRYALQYKLIT
ncbi:response regulator [Pokkaliibacter sp. CJK22405]|uniref:response regulator n=1 Tax=Pokkaliibacter sp. CJK22405 TaxID=3384615 RepID=UPI0039855323